MGSHYTCLQIFWTASKSLIYLDISCTNVQICFFFNLKTLTITGSRKNTFTGLKTPQNCLFSSHLFFRQSWTKVLGHFCISGAFSNSHRSNPSPHPTNNVGRVYPEFFSEFQQLYRVGGGRTARKFRKRCTVLRENRKIAEKYEYYSTVPRTFVQDWRELWGLFAEVGEKSVLGFQSYRQFFCKKWGFKRMPISQRLLYLQENK